MKKVFIATLFIFNALIAGEVYATFDVVSEKSSELGLSISGVVGALHVEVGDKVKKGDLILSLDNGQEKKELEIAKKNAEHSQKTYERYTSLKFRIQNIIDIVSV